MEFETAISVGITEEKRVQQLAAARRKVSLRRIQGGNIKTQADSTALEFPQSTWIRPIFRFLVTRRI
jgi:hypothetical protein